MIRTLTISVGYKSKNSTTYYSEQRVYLCEIEYEESEPEDNLWDGAYDILDIILTEIPLTKDFIDPTLSYPIICDFVGADIRCLTSPIYSHLWEEKISHPLLLTSYEIAFESQVDFDRYSSALISLEDPNHSFKAKLFRV